MSSRKPAEQAIRLLRLYTRLCTKLYTKLCTKLCTKLRTKLYIWRLCTKLCTKVSERLRAQLSHTTVINKHLLMHPHGPLSGGRKNFKKACPHRNLHYRISIQ